MVCININVFVFPWFYCNHLLLYELLHYWNKIERQWWCEMLLYFFVFQILNSKCLTSREENLHYEPYVPRALSLLEPRYRLFYQKIILALMKIIIKCFPSKCFHRFCSILGISNAGRTNRDFSWKYSKMTILGTFI